MEAAEQIAAAPALLAEVRRLLPALERRALRKAGESVSESGMTGTERVIAQRFETYPQPQRNAAQWGSFWRDYHQALDDLPLAAVEAGMRAWVDDPASEFLPKPGKLKALALDTESAAQKAYTRARAAVRAAERPVQERAMQPPLTDSEIAERKRLAAEALAMIGTKRADA